METGHNSNAQLKSIIERIEAREARQGFETDERTIPHEVGWIGSAVHLDKGCYRGQETVARVHTLGRPPRRLVMLHLDGSVDHLPGHGADVVADGRTVGFVGSSARHHVLGPIALALVRREASPGDSVSVGSDGVTAEIVEPPFAGDPDDVAARVLAAIESGRPVVYVPGIWRLVMIAVRALPRAVMRRVSSDRSSSPKRTVAS